MRRIALKEGWTTKCVCTTRCDAECLNRSTAIECSVESCNLGNIDCGNRQFLLGPGYQDLEVIQAGRKELGLGTKASGAVLVGCDLQGGGYRRQNDEGAYGSISSNRTQGLVSLSMVYCRD